MATMKKEYEHRIQLVSEQFKHFSDTTASHQLRVGDWESKFSQLSAAASADRAAHTATQTRLARLAEELATCQSQLASTRQQLSEAQQEALASQRHLASASEVAAERERARYEERDRAAKQYALHLSHVITVLESTIHKRLNDPRFRASHTIAASSAAGTSLAAALASGEVASAQARGTNAAARGSSSCRGSNAVGDSGGAGDRCGRCRQARCLSDLCNFPGCCHQVRQANIAVPIQSSPALASSSSPSLTTTALSARQGRSRLPSPPHTRHWRASSASPPPPASHPKPLPPTLLHPSSGPTTYGRDGAHNPYSLTSRPPSHVDTDLPSYVSLTTPATANSSRASPVEIRTLSRELAQLSAQYAQAVAAFAASRGGSHTQSVYTLRHNTRFREETMNQPALRKLLEEIEARRHALFTLGVVTSAPASMDGAIHAGGVSSTSASTVQQAFAPGSRPSEGHSQGSNQRPSSLGATQQHVMDAASEVERYIASLSNPSSSTSSSTPLPLSSPSLAPPSTAAFTAPTGPNTSVLSAYAYRPVAAVFSSAGSSTSASEALVPDRSHSRPLSGTAYSSAETYSMPSSAPSPSSLASSTWTPSAVDPFVAPRHSHATTLGDVAAASAAAAYATLSGAFTMSSSREDPSGRPDSELGRGASATSMSASLQRSVASPPLPTASTTTPRVTVSPLDGSISPAVDPSAGVGVGIGVGVSTSSGAAPPSLGATGNMPSNNVSAPSSASPSPPLLPDAGASRTASPWNAPPQVPGTTFPSTTVTTTTTNTTTASPLMLGAGASVSDPAEEGEGGYVDTGASSIRDVGW